MIFAEQGARRIRAAAAADAAAIQAIYGPVVETTAISFEEIAPTVGEMERRIVATLPTHPWLVCEEAGVVLGYAYAGSHKARAAYRWSVDVTVYIGAAARRSGVGRALYTVLFDLLARQNFHMAFAGIALPNPSSVGLHEAMGFRPLGVYPQVGFKFGRWHDAGWWQRPLSAATLPAEPIAFARLMAAS